MKKSYLTCFICLCLTACIGAGSSSSIRDKGVDMWPEITGVNLNGQTVSLPKDLQNQYSILAVGFERYHQQHIDEWHSWLKQTTNEKIKFYEVPIIYNMNIIKRFWLNNVMRYYIKDETIRGQTITVYTDREQLAEMMKLDLHDVYIFVINSEGKILWQEKGSLDETKEKKLGCFLRGILS